MKTYWHVTTAKAAQSIIKDGFKGDWGDAGFGVYVFDCLGRTTQFEGAGGWDGSLKDSAVIEIEVPEGELEYVMPDPEWPNPEDYECVLWYPMNSDLDENWCPKREIIV